MGAWFVVVLAAPPQLFWRDAGKTRTPLLLGDGSHRWWWTQLVLEVASQFPLFESDPACCCVVFGPPPIAVPAGASQYAVEHGISPLLLALVA